ncbi:MAG: ADP-ribosylglycohydrolase [Tissierellia bacterium]|nr:ADP-ribosylglycohydrolase [Tissierellia bacterium]
MKPTVYDGILGLSVGDALGVPVEFVSREELDSNPVVGMREYGTYNKPAGTWSDDTSMTLATAAVLCRDDISLYAMMEEYGKWMTEGKYTSDGETYDVGLTTRMAIEHFLANHDAGSCGMSGEGSNGNGSLMRILPLAYVLTAKYGYDLAKHPEAMETIHQVSAITHGHPISLVGCGIYVTVIGKLLDPKRAPWSVEMGLVEAREYYMNHSEYAPILDEYQRIFDESFYTLDRDAIVSSGYIVDTLEAALWSYMTTKTYQEAVLKAVNLGEDTDTVAAVTGALAGIAYGSKSIPQEWVEEIKGLNQIKEISKDLQTKIDIM